MKASDFSKEFFFDSSYLLIIKKNKKFNFSGNKYRIQKLGSS